MPGMVGVVAFTLRVLKLMLYNAICWNMVLGTESTCVILVGCPRSMYIVLFAADTSLLVFRASVMLLWADSNMSCAVTAGSGK